MAPLQRWPRVASTRSWSRRTESLPQASKRLRRSQPGIKLPSIGSKEYAEAGGLLGYGVNLLSLYRRAAYFVDLILKGARPADLPVEQPTKFELVINLKTAKTIGLTIANSFLLRRRPGDRVISPIGS